MQTALYYVFTVLFCGVPALILLFLAINCFLMRYRIRGVVSLLGSLFLFALLVFKLLNPDWSLLTR